MINLSKSSWENLLSKSITSSDGLKNKFKLNLNEVKKVIKKYPMCISPYYFSLIEKKDDPIWKQCIPSKKELKNSKIMWEDPLCEERDSPIPGLTHRYPDRVLFLVSNSCAVFCRFCTRKRKVGVPIKNISKKQIEKGISYIKEHREIRDVILSGGDPLLLSTKYLEWIIKEIRSISHVEIIRIGTRIPCTFPQRIDKQLCNMLKKYHPIYINTHFNHPREITKESKKACEMLANVGIPLGNQTVLLKGVNDNPEIMKELLQKLLSIRVRPYYMYQADLTAGTEHFRTKINKGLEIIQNIRGFTSGIAVPHYIIDAPGGGGKIPLLPKYLISKKGKKLRLKNYIGKEYEYIE